jgi:hypothetical protein
MNATHFETLIGGSKTYLMGSIADVVGYFRPGHPTLRAVKTGRSTWELRAGRRVIGTAQTWTPVTARRAR